MRSLAGGISGRSGATIAASTIPLVIISLSPVASLVGAAAPAVWAASAVIGLMMAAVFAEAALSLPPRSGGIPALGSIVLSERGEWRASIAQWSYWLGWSPGSGLSALTAALLLQEIAGLHGAGATWSIAVCVLIAGASVNHLGIKRIGMVQVPMTIAILAGFVALVAGPLLGGSVHLSDAFPLAARGGWASPAGIRGLLEALFLAGWTAYGAELALTYLTEYRTAARGAAAATVVVASLLLVAFIAMPLVASAATRTQRTTDDAFALVTFLTSSFSGGARALAGVWLTTVLLVAVSLLTLTSSRTLYQISKDGYGYEWLAKLNGRGAPGNAIWADLSVNVVLVSVSCAIADGASVDVPIVILVAANVAYFVAMILSLNACAIQLARRPAGARRPWLSRMARWLARGNTILLAWGAVSWGWKIALVSLGLLGSVWILAGHAARVRERRHVLSPRS